MTVNINDLNTQVDEAKKGFASNDNARATIDSLRDSIVNPETPPEITKELSSIISNASDPEKLAAAIGDLNDTLDERIKEQEEKVDQYHNEKDLAKEAAWIGVGIAAVIIGVATGGALLAVTVVVGLTAAVVDLAIKIPRETHEKNESKDEYKSLGPFGKASFIVKEMKEDKLKVAASAITLVGAAVLLMAVFSPAIILAAPAIIPAVSGVLLAIGAGLLAKTAYTYSQKEKQSTQQLETSISETNKLLESTEVLQTGASNKENNTPEILEENENIDTSEKSAANQNETKDFEQALLDTNISVKAKSDGEDLETKTTEKSSGKNQDESLFTKALDANEVPRPETSVKKDEGDSQKQPDNAQKTPEQGDESEGEGETRGPHP
ncbi:MAG: hypothetical protein HON55_04035 [Legionellales bacterium]|jgi:hypothetical protein|nr:hypothetical protein [Legionellales bacterium]